MKEYKAYIFDMDLTLLNTIETAIFSYDAAFKAVGKTFDENTVVHHLSIPLTASYAEIENPNGEFRLFYDAFKKVSEETFSKSVIYEDGLELIRNLVSCHKLLGIVTNRDNNNVFRVLENQKVKECFKSVITCDRVKNLKPDPEPILKCLEELNVSKEEAVYIGDARNDFMAAKNAGVDFIAIERYNNCDFDCKVKLKSLKEIEA